MHLALSSTDLFIHHSHVHITQHTNIYFLCTQHSSERVNEANSAEKYAHFYLHLITPKGAQLEFSIHLIVVVTIIRKISNAQNSLNQFLY